MSNIALSAFYDHLLPELKGCTTAMVDLHLLHVARDFCERTSAWRVAFNTSTEANQPTYDISAPELRSEIVRLTRMVIDDVVLWDDRWDVDSDSDEPKYTRVNPPFAMNDLNTEFTLIETETPTAAGTDNIELIAALKPAFASTTVPDILKFQHLEAMRTGTLSRLMRMGSKPWTDRPLAGEYMNDYSRLCNLAASTAQGGNTKRRLRVRNWG